MNPSARIGATPAPGVYPATTTGAVTTTQPAADSTGVTTAAPTKTAQASQQAEKKGEQEKAPTVRVQVHDNQVKVTPYSSGRFSGLSLTSNDDRFHAKIALNPGEVATYVDQTQERKILDPSLLQNPEGLAQIKNDKTDYAAQTGDKARLHALLVTPQQDAQGAVAKDAKGQPIIQSSRYIQEGSLAAPGANKQDKTPGNSPDTATNDRYRYLAEFDTQTGKVHVSVFDPNGQTPNKAINAADRLLNPAGNNALVGRQFRNGAGTLSTEYNLSDVIALGVIRAKKDIELKQQELDQKIAADDAKLHSVTGFIGNGRRKLTEAIGGGISNIGEAISGSPIGGLFNFDNQAKMKKQQEEKLKEAAHKAELKQLGLTENFGGLGSDSEADTKHNLEAIKKLQLAKLGQLEQAAQPGPDGHFNLPAFLEAYKAVCGHDFDIQHIQENLNTTVDVNGKPVQVQNSTVAGMAETQQAENVVNTYRKSNEQAAGYWGSALSMGAAFVADMGMNALSAKYKVFKNPWVKAGVRSFIGGTVNGLANEQAHANDPNWSWKNRAGAFSTGAALSVFSTPGAHGVSEKGVNWLKSRGGVVGKSTTMLDNGLQALHRADFGHFVPNVIKEHPMTQRAGNIINKTWNAGIRPIEPKLSEGLEKAIKEGDKTVFSSPEYINWQKEHADWRMANLKSRYLNPTQLVTRAGVGSVVGGVTGFATTPDKHADGTPVTAEERLQNTLKGAGIGAATSVAVGHYAPGVGKMAFGALPIAGQFLPLPQAVKAPLAFAIFPEKGLASYGAAAIGGLTVSPLLTAGQIWQQQPGDVDNASLTERYLNNAVNLGQGQMFAENGKSFLDVLMEPVNGMKDAETGLQRAGEANGQLALSGELTTAQLAQYEAQIKQAQLNQPIGAVTATSQPAPATAAPSSTTTPTAPNGTPAANNTVAFKRTAVPANTTH